MSIVITSYIKLFHTGAYRHKGILLPLLLLVAETTSQIWIQKMKNVAMENFIVWFVKIENKTVFYVVMRREKTFGLCCFLSAKN